MHILKKAAQRFRTGALRAARAAGRGIRRILAPVRAFLGVKVNAVACVAMAVVMSTGGIMAQAANGLCTATITDGDEVRVVLTLSNDPATVMARAGFELEPEDEVTHEFKSSELHIEITRAYDVAVLADGKRLTVRVLDETVGEALERAGVVLDQKDTVNYPLDEMVSDDMTIVVSRIAYREYSKTVSIPYTTKTEKTKTLHTGQTAVKTKGVKGEKTVTYREKIVNGEVVDTVVVEEIVTKKPVAAVKLLGTNNAIPLSLPKDGAIAVDDKGQPLQYKKKLTGVCTAYSSEEGTVGTRTSTGMKAQVGVVAVNPKVIPYGTKLYIVSPDGKIVYGYAVAGDTGGGVMRNQLLCDLFMNTIKECNAFGRRQMNVYIL